MASVPSVQQANVALVLLTSQLLATSSSSIPLSSFLDTTLGLTFLHSPLSSPRSFSAVSCPALSHSQCPQAGVLTAPPSLSSCCARGGCTPEVSAPPTLGSSITGPPLLAPSGPGVLTTSSVAGPGHIHTGVSLNTAHPPQTLFP